MEATNKKSAKTTKVVLMDLQTQAHRDHMKTNVLIFKFMGIWSNEKLLRS